MLNAETLIYYTMDHVCDFYSYLKNCHSLYFIIYINLFYSLYNEKLWLLLNYRIELYNN